MRHARLSAAGAVVALATTALLLGGLTAGTAPHRRKRASSATLADGFATGDTQALVAQLQAGLRERPDNVRGLDLLGLAYQQRARETGDPSYYVRSEGVLRRALSHAPNDLDATSGLASLALSRHRFGLGAPPRQARTRTLADDRPQLRRHRRRAPRARSLPRGVPVLRHDGAAAARASRRTRASPTHASCSAISTAPSRRSFSPPTQPPTSGSRTRGRRRSSASSSSPAVAWTRRPRTSATALQTFPGYVYALDAIAQVEIARGHLGTATGFEQRAVDTIPLPQFVGLLGDLLAATGHPRAARIEYTTEDGIRRLLVANGVQHRSRDRPLRRRPRHPAARLARARPARAARAAVDRR